MVLPSREPHRSALGGAVTDRYETILCERCGPMLLAEWVRYAAAGAPYGWYRHDLYRWVDEQGRRWWNWA